jgi:hypothetical protein
MQTMEEAGKFVTDGQHTYPYNAFLDEMLNSGKLQFCERPAAVKDGVAPKVTLRSPLTLPAEERMALAQRMGMTLGDVGNLSPQEFEEELKKLEALPTAEGFPAA